MSSYTHCPIEEEEKEVSDIIFSVFDNDTIRKYSVCQLTSYKLDEENSIYDERMGGHDPHQICITCKQVNMKCPGHFGHIELNEPIFHPLYLREILRYLKCFCYQCSEFLIQQRNKLGSITRIVEQCERIKSCFSCTQIQPRWIMSKEHEFVQVFKGDDRIIVSSKSVQSIFDKIPDRAMTYFRLNSEYIHPRYFIMNVLPVLPNKCRPLIKSDDGMIYDDDLSKRYIEIIKTNQRIIKLKEGTNDAKSIESCIRSLRMHIQILMDNTSMQVKITGQHVIKSLKHRITGKDGRIRNNLMGKRCNFTARTVVGPDPTLKIEQVGIPESMARILTIPERVHAWNMKWIQSLVSNQQANFIIKKNGSRINLEYAFFRIYPFKPIAGDYLIRNGITSIIQYPCQYQYQKGDKIKKGRVYFKLEIGDIVERHVQNGDWVLLNRQPTLHRGSMLALQTKIVSGQTIRVNLGITSSYNMDFDGDEGNIHVPQTILARSDCALASIETHLLHSQDGKPIPSLIQDAVLGIYLLTRPQEQVPVQEWMQWSMKIELGNLSNTRTNTYPLDSTIPGIVIVESCLPSTYHSTRLSIRNGKCSQYPLKKSHLQTMIRELGIYYSHSIAIEFINRIQFLAYAYLTWKGFSVGIQACISKLDVHFHSSLLAKVNQVESTLKSRLGNISQSSDLSQLLESRIVQQLNQLKDQQQVIAKEQIQSDNPFVQMIESGSKGNYMNLCQIVSLLGQQNVSGKRIQPQLSEYTRTLSCYPFQDQTCRLELEQQYQSRGFITHSFLQGLQPTEFFFHASSGREGITDTSCKTADSGYLQRKMVKLLEDVQIQYDGTVRNAKNQIIQFVYGEDGLNGSTLNQSNRIFSLQDLVDQLESTIQ